jgi:hypothetical protein
METKDNTIKLKKEDKRKITQNTEKKSQNK